MAHIRIGLGIGEIGNRSATVSGLLDQARQAEADGFASIWLANIFGPDALMAAALIGTVTQKIEIGTAVVPTFPRHPHAMAQQALTAQAATGGRLALGIGLSHQMVIENMFGLSWAKPYSHMREYLAALLPLIREGAVAFDGDQFRIHANLSIAGAKPCPVLVAALAPKMLALAGSVADGTITWMTGPQTIERHTAPRIREAAAAAERPAPRIVVGLPVAVTEDAAAARAAAAKVFAIYGSLPSYRAMLDREGAEGPAGVAIVGSEAEVTEAIDGLGAVGATDFLASTFPVGEDGGETMARTRALLKTLAAR